MSDLISRQAVIDALYYWSNHTMTDAEAWHLRQVIGDIKSMSSAEPERKKGTWKDGILYQDFDESEWEKVKCSVCKRFVVKQIFYHDNKYHFCPYCGADMRTKGNENV